MHKHERRCTDSHMLCMFSEVKKKKTKQNTDTSSRVLCQWDRQETEEQIHLRVIIFQGQDITQTCVSAVQLVTLGTNHQFCP